MHNDLTQSQEVVKQAELTLLLNIEQSLRIALESTTRHRGNSRKLSTLRFVARSFERQLTHTRVLTDHGGYVHLITDAKPDVASDAGALKGARDELQARLERIIVRLESVSPDDNAGFGGVCAELKRYLEDLEAHDRKETELVQRFFGQNEGEPDEAADSGWNVDSASEAIRGCFVVTVLFGM